MQYIPCSYEYATDSMNFSDSCELFGNSESSSCTSGHSSDHRIHEFIGDSAHGSFTDNFVSGICGFGIDDPESFVGPRSNRTCSVGSKPEQFKKKTRYCALFHLKNFSIYVYF